jgi:hypothetical protein
VVDDKEVCRIEVESPITGAKTLQQDPFSDLSYLQANAWLEPDPEGGVEPVLKGTTERKYNFTAAQEQLERRTR